MRITWLRLSTLVWHTFVECLTSFEALELAVKDKRQLKSEESVLNDQMNRLETFRNEPSPLDIASFRKIADYWSGDIAHELWDATDEVKARFAELFDLQATILPDGSRTGYHINLSANIPLEMEGDKPGAYDMVFSPSRRGLRG